jgi:hypothetical protein
MCEYCNTVTGTHFRGCPLEPDDDTDDMDAPPMAEVFDAWELWDDDRWNK